MKPQFNKVLKCFLSLWILYHLAVILILPNGGSYLGRRFENWLTPYANIFGINNTWNLFSPDPAHPMYFRYRVFFRNEWLEDLEPPIEGFFPHDRDQRAPSLSEQRELYAMRFLIIDPRRVETILGPWLCRQYPGASAVKLEHIINSLPPLDRAAQGSEDLSDMKEKIEFVNRDFNCHGKNDEVSD